ncbi:oligopeptide/dipeptide ABC transporter, ATPase subunit [Haladaptatus paucihalophilus DX253]|uniref:Oligopeptide/dipeptide ABC transporter, ATPase subunit n=1 Tax=Haladaptatus paucihalophilus DX253 TaxID=797209 RepID=E7QZC1_HALPU|nr:MULTISPECIES: oligopeptide/dipeptide ABC transporter ATP-binding protein [Haladaptatus]EFW90042.1 oligopeptide/dipeptide ABC transporter, ATPase subunit [Haladaptatus paucihalophilus DX253]GKZ14475.1 dipeptide/oligopeptide/nickel ABC transporter ATP-binding protein [Haladaptatus sp. T7]SHL03538.1 peptide/nickel transport system ATP-binding protein [Haladaptatus paucihalophilus DX253]
MISEQTNVHSSEVTDPILSIQNASVTYDDGESYVLNDVSLDIGRNEIVGVVGESGSGKSMFAETILDAIPDPGILEGRVVYRPDGGTEIDVLEQSDEGLRSMRWEQISMVFQGAMSSFNPTMSIGDHFHDTLDAHDADRTAGMERARELLSDLYLDPERVLASYPHELSGGMQQRALIALSLVLEPDILVMDEPTAALDLLMQQSILILLKELREKYDLTMVFITHDLPLVAALADRLAVMYAFDIVEVGPAEEIVDDAAHPYTRALLNSTPSLNAPLEEMRPIEGQSPAPINVPDGCSYHPRCPLATSECVRNDPAFETPSPNHAAACFHWEEAREEIALNYEDLLEHPSERPGGEDR